jgi:ABC-type sugar transport system substrate-binding protein
MNVIVAGVPFWRETKATWESIGNALPYVRTSYGGPLDTDPQKQIPEIEALLAKGVSGLVITPPDEGSLENVINQATGQGVGVVTYLVDSPNSRRLTYIASELEAASEKVAAAVGQSHGFRGGVIISYAQAGNSEQEARARGFRQAIERHPELHLVATVEDNYDESTGAQRLRPLLEKHPDVRYIFGCNSRSAVGAVTALRESGREAGSVIVTGWDYDEDVLNFIKSGWVETTVAQRSAFMTQLAFAILQAHRNGFLYPRTIGLAQNGESPLPSEIIVPVTLVDASNADAFMPTR